MARQDRLTRADAQARYFDMLTAANSPLLHAGEAVREQLIGQFNAIVDAATSSADQGMVEVLSLNIGHSRAAAAIHPTASLAAANMIFAASLPFVTEELEAQKVDDPRTAAALRLNEAILRRMAAAAVAYVRHLLETSGTADRKPATARPAGAPLVLTARESEVLAATAAASTNREIAAQLRISEATVKRHLATIYAKLGARSRIQAVEHARSLGLIHH
jgi:DNA-binding CsgD family transcriptional regulator